MLIGFTISYLLQIKFLRLLAYDRVVLCDQRSKEAMQRKRDEARADELRNNKTHLLLYSHAGLGPSEFSSPR